MSHTCSKSPISSPKVSDITDDKRNRKLELFSFSDARRNAQGNRDSYSNLVGNIDNSCEEKLFAFGQNVLKDAEIIVTGRPLLSLVVDRSVRLLGIQAGWQMHEQSTISNRLRNSVRTPEIWSGSGISRWEHAKHNNNTNTAKIREAVFRPSGHYFSVSEVRRRILLCTAVQYPVVRLVRAG